MELVLVRGPLSKDGIEKQLESTMFLEILIGVQAPLLHAICNHY